MGWGWEHAEVSEERMMSVSLRALYTWRLTLRMTNCSYLAGAEIFQGCGIFKANTRTVLRKQGPLYPYELDELLCEEGSNEAR